MSLAAAQIGAYLQDAIASPPHLLDVGAGAGRRNEVAEQLLPDAALVVGPAITRCVVRFNTCL